MKLKKILKLIKKLSHEYDSGIYNTQNITGDDMRNVYNSKDIVINVCDEYNYIEVFCEDKYFNIIKEYYYLLFECNRAKQTYDFYKRKIEKYLKSIS